MFWTVKGRGKVRLETSGQSKAMRMAGPVLRPGLMFRYLSSGPFFIKLKKQKKKKIIIND